MFFHNKRMFHLIFRFLASISLRGLAWFSVHCDSSKERRVCVFFPTVQNFVSLPRRRDKRDTHTQRDCLRRRNEKMKKHKSIETKLKATLLTQHLLIFSRKWLYSLGVEVSANGHRKLHQAHAHP